MVVYMSAKGTTIISISHLHYTRLFSPDGPFQTLDKRDQTGEMRTFFVQRNMTQSINRARYPALLGRFTNRASFSHARDGDLPPPLLEAFWLSTRRVHLAHFCLRLLSMQEHPHT